MDLRGLSGSAMAAYMTGMQAIGQSKDVSRQAALAAKAGNVSYASFASVLRQPEVRNSAGAEMDGQTEGYYDHLKEKYGVVRIESVGRDQKSLDRAGAAMGGTDVVIAPNMLEKMAKDPETAKRIEGTIDYFFNNIPKYEAEAVAMGLTFESCGCVVHEDGTVTYICGGGDPPERVAEVEREHKEKLEKEAEKRKESAKKAQEEADRRRRIAMESLNQGEALSQLLENYNNVSASLSGGFFFINETVNAVAVSSPFSGIGGGFLNV